MPRRAIFVELFFGAVNRNGKSDANAACLAASAALGTVDRRVDSDDVTPGVQQRAAAVTGIDGGVGLDQAFQRISILIRKAAAERAYDAGCERAFEPERIADREHLLANNQDYRSCPDARMAASGRL